ncbi:MAG: 50S ribosomal protein L17 [Candidatus Woesebacteria bacterium]|jgi:large subunit ribosomal protein L17
MKKRIGGKKLSRSQGARKALFRSLTKALVEHGSIETTRAKAYFVRKNLEKLISRSKQNTVAARRLVYARLGNDRKTTDKLFNEIAPRFKDRRGGFIRIINLPRRRGDQAKLARLEWTIDTTKEKGRKKKKVEKGKKEKDAKTETKTKSKGKKK